MRGSVLALALLLTLTSATRLSADEPRMLLRNSWAHLPTEAELNQCPLDGALQGSRSMTIGLTCDVDDDGKLRACTADERTPPPLAAYAICVSQYFEVRPGVHGQVFVPIGLQAR